MPMSIDQTAAATNLVKNLCALSDKYQRELHPLLMGYLLIEAGNAYIKAWITE
jgi:hypothetical protein